MPLRFKLLNVQRVRLVCMQRCTTQIALASSFKYLIMCTLVKHDVCFVLQCVKNFGTGPVSLVSFCVWCLFITEHLK